MNESLAQRIVEFVRARNAHPMRPRPLARAMAISESQYRDFARTLDDLVNAGRLTLGGGGVVRPPITPGRVTGVFRSNRKGFGFVTPEVSHDGEDLFVPPGATLDAQDGDTVLCRVRRTGWRDGKPSYSAQVVEIVRREHTRCVGKLHHEAGRWYVQPDGTKLHQPVFVDDVGAKQARSGDMVVIEVVQFPQAGQVARGVIVERLGAAGKPGVDVLAMIRQYRLPDVFSEAALADARQAAKGFDAALGDRLDLRDVLTVTIDPVTARDFDDAISLRRLDRNENPQHSPGERRDAGSAGGREARNAARKSHKSGPAAWELGVHIADVSHFVREGGALDAAAHERGTSVYFPRHVVPMLPELLSNGVCSLQENQPRYCKSAFIEYDREGHVVGARLANTLIRSDKRLTYEQASAALEGDAGDLPHAVVALLLEMEKLARAIRKRRLSEGMLVLDLPEVELVLDDDGRVTDARPADQSFSHTLIEMFMVEANEAAARFLDSRGETFLRRVHPPPDEEAIEELAKRLRGANCLLSKNADRFELQRVIDSVRGKPASRVVNMAVLRSMAQAVYSPKREGHYALASGDYSHFTSPIRRYPDLHIHRLLERHIGETQKRKSVETSKKVIRRRDAETDPRDVAALGVHCSLTERRAEQAERELKLVKVLDLLSRHPGEAFDGFVTSVTSFGLFVQHPRYMVDGLLEMGDLPDDHWTVEQKTGVLLGRRTGKRIRVGDVLRVAIARVDVTTRRLALAMVEDVAPRVSKAAGASADRWEKKRRAKRPSRGRRGR